MVAICRVNRAMSMGFTFLPAPSREIPFLRTLSGLMPCLRRWAFTSMGFCPVSSPLTLAPFLSVPSQMKTLVLTLCPPWINPWSRG